MHRVLDGIAIAVCTGALAAILTPTHAALPGRAGGLLSAPQALTATDRTDLDWVAVVNSSPVLCTGGQSPEPQGQGDVHSCTALIARTRTSQVVVLLGGAGQSLR